MSHAVLTLNTLTPDQMPAHLAIGIFDGVHRGHRRVIEQAIKQAKQDHTLSGVLTFTPHPSRVLHPAQATRLIMPLENKVSELQRAGVDVIICEPFTLELAKQEAEAFLPLLKEAIPHLKNIYVGGNFRFGNKRLGNPERMKAWGASLGIEVISAPNLLHHDTPISSTRIRNMLAEGSIETANDCLGYTYFSEGTIQGGQQMGRTLGFPTLNVPWQPEQEPRYGVYVVRVCDTQGTTRKAVANYGLRPTVNQQDKQPLLEVHILEGDCPWDTNDFIRVEWLSRLRPEQSFESTEALRNQIEIDCEQARQLHDKNS